MTTAANETVTTLPTIRYHKFLSWYNRIMQEAWFKTFAKNATHFYVENQVRIFFHAL